MPTAVSVEPPLLFIHEFVKTYNTIIQTENRFSMKQIMNEWNTRKIEVSVGLGMY